MAGEVEINFLKKINMKKPALIIVFLVILILGLSVVKTFASNRISTSGSVLGSMEEKISYYPIENTMLDEKLYSLSSLTNLLNAFLQVWKSNQKAKEDPKKYSSVIYIIRKVAQKV